VSLRTAAGAALDRPRLTLGVFLVLTLAWLPALPRLHLQVDGRDLFHPDHPAVVFQQHVDETFASSDLLVIGIEPRRGHDLFAPAPLNAILRLTQRLSALAGVKGEEVRSLATEVSPEWSEGMLVLAPPLQAPVRSSLQAAAVRRAALREPSFRGVLLSKDAGMAAIYVPLDRKADRRVLYYRIAALAGELWRQDPGLAGYRMHLVGPAAAESLLGDHVLADIARLLPLALAVVAAILWFWFHQVSIVLVGLGEGIAVVLWTLGLMGLLGQPISLVTVVMPVILSTYCVADSIHLAVRFAAHCRNPEIGSRRQAMDRTLDEVLTPIAFTSIATAAGFLSFGVSPIPPLRDFGLFSTFGILLALAISAFVVPAALLATRFGLTEVRYAVHPRITAALARLSVIAARRPWRVIALVALGTALIGAGAGRLTIQDSWVRNFDASSPLVRSDRWFNRSFFGSNVLNVVIAPHGSVHDPSFQSELARLQDLLDRREEVGGSLSLVDPLRAVGRCLEGTGRLPRVERESQEWCLLYRMAGGNRSLSPYLDAAESAVDLWVFLNRADYGKTAAIVRQVRDFDWRLPGGRRPETRLAGDAYLGYELVGSIARGQGSSAFGALALTFLTAWLMVRSLPGALMVVLPVAVSVLWNFGFMGWLGMPLGIATSTFSAIAFGIGVDFAIHWAARMRLGLLYGLRWGRSIRFTGTTAGGAVLLQGYVVFFGFSVLLFSSVPPNRVLALVLCVNLATCLGATLLLLPAVATLLRHRMAPGAARIAIRPAEIST
jgi:predicted RND superfamily exporter protein